MDSGELKQRTKTFAHRCVKLCAALPNTDLGRVIRGQLLRCSTSVAANYRAACLAQTRRVFASKLSNVLEGTDEAAFWLEFTMDERLLVRPLIEPLYGEATELTAIFAAARKTSSKPPRDRSHNNE